MPDIVFYHNEAIYTIYNHLLAKTYNEFSINDSQDLCQPLHFSKDKKIFSSFTEDVKNSVGNNDIVIQNISEFVKAGFEIEGIANPYSAGAFEVGNGGFQGRLRYGDLNIDGYPDLLFTLAVRGNESGEKEYQSFILFGTDCNDQICEGVEFESGDSSRESEILVSEGNGQRKPLVRSSRRYFSLEDPVG